MKNKLSDLNDHLFEQLERLNDNELSGDALKTEIARSKSMTEIAEQIIDNAKTTVAGMKVANDLGLPIEKELPPMLAAPKDIGTYSGKNGEPVAEGETADNEGGSDAEGEE